MILSLSQQRQEIPSRYLGDLSGGQLLKKAAIRGMKLPADGSGQGPEIVWRTCRISVVGHRGRPSSTSADQAHFKPVHSTMFQDPAMFLLAACSGQWPDAAIIHDRWPPQIWTAKLANPKNRLWEILLLERMFLNQVLNYCTRCIQQVCLGWQWLNGWHDFDLQHVHPTELPDRKSSGKSHM